MRDGHSREDGMEWNEGENGERNGGRVASEKPAAAAGLIISSSSFHDAFRLALTLEDGHHNQESTALGRDRLASAWQPNASLWRPTGPVTNAQRRRELPANSPASRDVQASPRGH